MGRERVANDSVGFGVDGGFVAAAQVRQGVPVPAGDPCDELAVAEGRDDSLVRGHMLGARLLSQVKSKLHKLR